MGALDGRMAGDQLPGPVPVTNAAPGSDDVATPEERRLEVERVEAAAALRTGATVDELEDQAPRSRRADQVIDHALVDGDAGVDQLATGRSRVNARLAAGDITGGTVPESLRGRFCHHWP